MHEFAKCLQTYVCKSDSLRGSSDKIGTIQRRLAWPLRKDDTHTSRSVNMVFAKCRSVAMLAQRTSVAMQHYEHNDHGTCGLVAMTCASHAESRQFDAGQV